MKFDLGHWRVLPGTEAVFPVTIMDVRIESDALVVVGYDRPVTGAQRYAGWRDHHRAIYVAHAERDPRPAYPLQGTARTVYPPSIWTTASAIRRRPSMKRTSRAADKWQSVRSRADAGDWDFSFQRAA